MMDAELDPKVVLSTPDSKLSLNLAWPTKGGGMKRNGVWGGEAYFVFLRFEILKKLT